MSRCGCGLFDFSTSRDRGKATVQGRRNRTSCVGGDGADPAPRTCAESRPRGKSAATAEIHRHVSWPAADHESRCGGVGRHIPQHLRDGPRQERQIVRRLWRAHPLHHRQPVTCDLYDASREAESTELLSGARLKTTIIGDVDDPRVNPGIPEHVTDGVKSRWRARLPARGRVRRR